MKKKTKVVKQKRTYVKKDKTTVTEQVSCRHISTGYEILPTANGFILMPTICSDTHGSRVDNMNRTYVFETAAALADFVADNFEPKYDILTSSVNCAKEARSDGSR